MSGIADWSPRKSFWVWATFGPGLDGIEDGLYFRNGIHPHPLPGPIAEKYQLMGGYMATPYDPGLGFSHWDGEGYRRIARFTLPINRDFPSPPEVAPEELPPEWVGFFKHYTASGKRKKRAA